MTEHDSGLDSDSATGIENAIAQLSLPLPPPPRPPPLSQTAEDGIAGAGCSPALWMGWESQY